MLVCQGEKLGSPCCYSGYGVYLFGGTHSLQILPFRQVTAVFLDWDQDLNYLTRSAGVHALLTAGKIFFLFQFLKKAPRWEPVRKFSTLLSRRINR
jgi:hypothetical protein